MIARSIFETRNITTAATVGTSGQYSIRIPQQRRRLEAILIEVTGTCATLTTPTQDSYGAVLKRIRLKVNDGRSRSMVDANGVSLLELWSRMGGNKPARNQAYVAKQSTGAFLMYYYVPIRIPFLDDPAGVITGLPLYGLNEDPTLEIDTGSTEVAATFALTGTMTINATFVYRNDTSADYIPTEIVTAADLASQSASSRLSFDLATGGALVGVLVQAFTNAALTTRGSGLSSGGLYELQYGRETVRQGTENQLEAWDGLASNGPITATDPGNSFFLNFLDDMPLGAAFSANSLLNLETVGNGGDMAKLIVTQSAASTPGYRLTTYKILGGAINKLQLV